MEAKEILEKLRRESTIEMQTSEDLLIISFRKFFGTEKEFLFELNCKPIDSCKSIKTGLKKIEKFINRGFEIIEL